MKIKINEHESYELILPDEMSASEFFSFQNRINHVAKLLGKDPFIQAASENLTPKSSSQKRRSRIPHSEKPWFQSRDEGIEILKMYYIWTTNQKETYAETNNVTSHILKNDMQIIKQKYSIQPEEVGLEYFPKPGQNPQFINNENN